MGRNDSDHADRKIPLKALRLSPMTMTPRDGRFSGAQIQITSKSGTNEYHGSAFFTAHRPGLNAYQPCNGGVNPLRDPSRFNQIGGSVGGPIIKNKIFGFFSYETMPRAQANVPGNQWGDTAAFDALAPSGTIASTLVNYPGNGILNTGVNTVHLLERRLDRRSRTATQLLVV